MDEKIVLLKYIFVLPQFFHIFPHTNKYKFPTTRKNTITDLKPVTPENVGGNSHKS